MKKIVSLLLTIILTLGTASLASASKINANSEIQTIINNYFTSQLDSRKNGDDASFINIKDNFDFSIDTSKAIYDYELGKLQYNIASDKLSQYIIKDYQLKQL